MAVDQLFYGVQLFAITAALAFSLPLVIVYFLCKASRSAVAPLSAEAPRVPPGTLGLPVIGENLALLSSFSIHAFIRERYQRYGKIFKTSIFGHVAVFLEGTDAAKFILSNESKLFRLSTAKSMMDMVGPRSLFESTGDAHKRLRRILGDPLSMDSLKKHLNGMEDVAMDVLRTWKHKGKVCVLQEATDYAFQIISYILMSSRPGEEQQKMKAYFQKIAEALAVLPINIPGFAYHKGLLASKELHSLLASIIQRRREARDQNEDFLQLVLNNQSTYAIESLHSDKEILDSLIAILLAGHETSATSIMWAMKFIEDYPDVKEKLMMEHTNLKRRRDLKEHLRWEEMNQMLYTNKFINEVFRVANIVHLLARRVLEDIEIDGYVVKKGWKVIVDTQGPHFDARYFENPHEFQPNRFDEAPKPNTFMPFGGGARLCLGMNLARLEMAIFIHHLMISYRWESISKDHTLTQTLVPKLKNGYLIKVDPLTDTNSNIV